MRGGVRLGKRTIKTFLCITALLVSVTFSAVGCGGSGNGGSEGQKDGQKTETQEEKSQETAALGSEEQQETGGTPEIQSEIQKILGPAIGEAESGGDENGVSGAKKADGQTGETQKDGAGSQITENKEDGAGSQITENKEDGAGSQETENKESGAGANETENKEEVTEAQTVTGDKEGSGEQQEPGDGGQEAAGRNKWFMIAVGAAILVVAAGIFLAGFRRKGKKDEGSMAADKKQLSPKESGERKRQDAGNGPQKSPGIAEKSSRDIPSSFGWGDGGFAVRIGNAHHIGARQNQQDSFSISDVTDDKLCRERGIFAVVADGMGGLSNGAQISATVTSSMQSSFLTGGPAEPSMKLLEMLHYANRQVNDYLRWNPGTQSGSTVVAVLIKGASMHFISVGDSRIYLCRGKTLTQLNREHTYASDLDEKAAKGEISLEEAMSDPQRKALTSYIGMGELAKIDRSVHPFQLVPGDRILLMSDGVFGTLTAKEIWEAVQTDAYHGAERIEQLVLAKNKASQDNFTAVVIECVGDVQYEKG